MTVGVVGLGLIGGSIAEGLRLGGWRVFGFDPDPAARTAALRKELCTEVLAAPAALGEAELLVLATPPSALGAALVATPAHPEATWTDVASIKGFVAETVPPELRSRFVPGHPMAGAEAGGASNARGDLFHGATWVLCPFPETEAPARERVLAMVRALRALPLTLTPQEHDAHVAVLSHLPHVFAAQLLRQAAPLRQSVGGGSWRDLTRVGGASPDLWADILVHNREAMLTALDAAAEGLGDFRRALLDEDRPALKALIEQARAAKDTPR